MQIAIIGTGNVGGALAANWAKAGHRVRLGVRDLDNFKGRELLELPNISAHTMAEAVAASEAVLIAATPPAVFSIVEQMGPAEGKIIIDAMNTIRGGAEPFANTFEALKHLAKGAVVVKCFNTTGFENMADPHYPGGALDMFVAGDSAEGKETARRLALDAGFAGCHDFGGDDKAALLEQFALCWINLAIMQGHGRNIGFKLLRR
jgi:hypothetical protein